MFKDKIIILSLWTAFVVTPAYCQVKLNPVQNIIRGTVIKVDTVGSVITILTDDQKQMAFFVPDKASVTKETQDIGLMDIKETNPVTIQYYVSPAGKYMVRSIIDNEPAHLDSA